MKVRGTTRSAAAFTLLEVMIASGIFFVVSFSILAMVAQSLRNAKYLQRPPVDAGIVAAQYVSTNRFSEGTMNGNFEDDALRDYSWRVDTFEAGTNGLLEAHVILDRHGLKGPADEVTILVFDPNYRATPGGGVRVR